MLVAEQFHKLKWIKQSNNKLKTIITQFHTIPQKVWVNVLRFLLEVHKKMTHFSFSSGLINIPAVALGIFSGGIVMKKFRISIRGAAKLYLGSSVLGYLLFLSLFALGCENSDVAGLTISYQGYVYSLSNQRRSVCLTKLIIVFQAKIIKLLRTYL